MCGICKSNVSCGRSEIDSGTTWFDHVQVLCMLACFAGSTPIETDGPAREPSRDFLHNNVFFALLFG